ncbi:MAG: SusC/RagA family TonB-linked outer membrane protein [Prevotellaceae bacterium]|jgi:TonB-linked SusC/RagA family outer membrane protein|nr:SusC/RagA family TonB-linked outer membrane protein [Prevotellaceae bacterium]
MKLNKIKRTGHRLLRKTCLLAGVCLLTMLGFTPVNAQQQSKTIIGTVVDKSGEPMVGAAVVVKGTTKAVATDVDGKFSLSVSEGDVLTVSFIGYTTKNVTVSAANTLTVTLEENAQMLDEIEITAEFGMKRVARSIGSSVQNVKAADIIESGRDNFISALQGRVAGMNVISSGGAPGASNTVILRSLTSISGNNQPLYVVDGIPMNNSSFSASSGFARADVYSSRYLDFSSRGDDFNPEDIESMTILKGAAAAALYGSNASNGAIIITTKKGAPGKGKVSYSNSFRWDSAYGYPELQDKYANGGYGATSYYNLSRFGGLYPEGTTLYDNVAAILQTGFTSKHNIAVEAGTASTTIRAAASFLDQTGVVKTTDYGRTSISLSGKSEITKWLKMEASMQYASTTNTKVQKGSSGPLRWAMRWPMVDDMSNYLAPDGMHMRYPERYVDTDLYNPIFGMNKNKFYDESDRIIANAVVIVTPTKNTFLRAQAGWDVGAQTFETSEHPYFTTNNYNVLPGNGGVYNLSKSNFSDPAMNILAGYNDSFFQDKLTVSAQVGYHQLENGVTRLSTYGTKFAVVDLQSINNCDPTTVSSKKRASKRRIQAISAQAEVGWNNMAFLTFRARNDWSSTLPKDNNSYFYPALEGAFVATELPFLKENKYVTYLKLRGAIAQVGKDAGPLEINPELEPTQQSGGGYRYGWTGPNLDLRPEMTTSWEAGFEGRFFNDRVVADFTYFNTRCEDQIVKEFRMSYAGGFVLNTQNMGTFETWGWEAHIDGDIFNTNGFRWNIGLNLSHTGSEVISMPVPEYYDAYTNGNTAGIRNGVMVGYPVTTVTGTDFQRNDKGEVLIDPSTGIPLVSSEWTMLADREPKVRLGFNTVLSYKGFRLSAMFAGKLGANVVNGTKREMMSSGLSWESVDFRERGPVVFNGVLKDGNENSDHPTPNILSVTYGDYSASIYAGAAANWIEKNVHYIRLQELRFSYTIPTNYLKKFLNGFVSYASVFVCGNDLFTITNYSGIDAVGNTLSASAGGTGGEGYDTWAIPNPRGLSFGVSLTFN